MTVTFVGKGTSDSGTGAITPGLPTGILPGDLLLLFTEIGNLVTPDSLWTITPAWTNIGLMAFNNGGTSGAAGYVLSDCHYRFATGTDSAPTLADLGDHQYAVILAYRGVRTDILPSSYPVDHTVTAVAGTALSFPSITTTLNSALIVGAAYLSLDAISTSTTSGITNANLTSITERHDETVTAGVGGGIVIFDGYKVTAGATGVSTATVTSTTWVCYHLALEPGPTISYVGKGTASSGTGAVSPTIPSGVIAGDLLLLCVDTSTAQAISTPAGWTALVSQDNAVPAGGINSTLCQVFALVATGSDSAPSIADPGDHCYALIIAYRGVDVTRLPGAAGTYSVNASVGQTTTPSWLTVSTNVPNTLVCLVYAHALDSASTAVMSGITNANLSGVTERHDEAVTAGTGGGLVIADGFAPSVGAIGSTTATTPFASYVSFALLLIPTILSSPTVTGVTTTTATPQITVY